MCTIHRYLWENKSSEQYIVQIEIQEQHYVQFIQFLVIILQSAKLDSSPMLEARKIKVSYFCHVSFIKMLISCLLKSIVFIKYFESDFLEK